MIFEAFMYTYPELLRNPTNKDEVYEILCRLHTDIICDALKESLRSLIERLKELGKDRIYEEVRRMKAWVFE